jgi:hypothetical protein
VGGVTAIPMDDAVGIQQINLYRKQDENGLLDTHTRLSLLTVGVAVIGLLLFGAVGEYQLSSVAEQRADIARDLSLLRTQIEQRNPSLVAPSIDPFLESELDGLVRRQQYLRDNLAALSRHQASTEREFPAFFTALARNAVDGLWFDHIGLVAGGAEVVLKGRTTDPALLPKLLQQLASEPAFSGRTFRRASLQRADDDAAAKVVGFELRSADSGEGKDAG